MPFVPLALFRSLTDLLGPLFTCLLTKGIQEEPKDRRGKICALAFACASRQQVIPSDVIEANDRDEAEFSEHSRSQGMRQKGIVLVQVSPRSYTGAQF